MGTRLFYYMFFGVYLFTALSIPYIYQSMTLWYKYGMDKVVLQGAQFIGIIAFVQIYAQILLATAGKSMEESFGRAKLMKWHKLNGMLIFICAFCHVLLVLVPEGLENLPVGFRFWPELIGLCLIVILAFTITTSLYRQRLRLSYVRWRTLHRLCGYSGLFLVTSHMFFVSDSFENMLPKIFLLVSFLGLCLRVCIVKRSRSVVKNH